MSDENDLLRAGRLPADPGDGLQLVRTPARDGNGSRDASPADGPELFGDTWNGQEFARDHEGAALFVDFEKEWLAWDGRHWGRGGVTLHKAAQDWLRNLHSRASSFRDQERFLKHVIASQGAGRVRGLLECAQGHLRVVADDLDRDPWLVNCGNGTLDTRKGKLRPHRKADYITKLCPHDFDPDARAPRWKRFLNEVFKGNKRLVRYVQRLFGYVLSGSIEAHVFPVLWGEGRNGKTTFVDTIKHVLGPDYVMEAPRDLIMETRFHDHTTGIMDLRGKKLAVSAETNETRTLDEALVKSLTGGNSIRARRLYADHVEFRPTHKLMLETNYKPTIRGTDLAIWSRVKLIPFEATFTGKRCDLNLRRKLEREAPGILAWMSRGCAAWKNKGLVDPPEVLLATKEYRRDSDILGRFLEDTVTERPDARVSASALYAVYTVWCRKRGEAFRMSSTVFGRGVSERFEKVHARDGSHYVGLRLKPSWRRFLELEP